ncbi:MAG: ABC transporter ATP-binding protein [Lachnospiraceae bacterium]|nr:ABC transporter ATP-binding protein [Lachnospiraceae bacterium]
MLEVKDLHVSYGAIKAVRGVSFSVEKGEIITIIGANGAGKSTILNTLAGVVKPASGEILLHKDGHEPENVFGAPSHRIVKKGIVLSPEGRQVFPRMTVRENLQLGSYVLGKDEDREKNMEWAFSLFPILKARLNQLGGTLSGGEQQMLAIARALQANPEILMLDEPSLGLAPIVVRDIFELFKEINKSGVTILLVEQNARMALGISDRGYVLENGKIVMTGTGKQLADDEKVRAAYLGG